MSQLTLYLLGPPRIEYEGTPIEVDRRKAIALITYLAMTEESHSRDRLATLFWPDYDQSRARSALRSALWALNKTPAGTWLDVSQETLGLRFDGNLWVDVAHFRHLLGMCGTHNHPPDEVCPACLPALAEAVALYRDDFMAGFTLPDSPDFDEWQFFEAEVLRQTLAMALERLVQGHLAQGKPEAAIPYARRQLGLDPLHEPVHRQLMQLYAQNGQQAAALRQYQLCAQALQDELGIAPSKETTELYERIRAGNFFGPSVPLQVTPPVHRHNLPAQTTPFIGRETELAELAYLLNEPSPRLVSILGPGGIGKTRLALELAAHQVETYPHGVYFVPLAPLGVAEQIVPAIAEAINFPLQGGERSPQQQLFDYLSQKQMLLLLDNFEHLLDGAELIYKMLQAEPDLKVLVTTRERLNLSSETVFTLGSLAFPTRETPKGADQYSAIQLFVQTAQHARPGFELNANEWQYVARICRLVGGMPLGIVLAAAWVQILTPEEIATELTQSFDFLATDFRDIPERQRSIRVVFAYSWHRLTETERAVFMRLSVFRGGFTRQAAQTVTGASLRTLTGLVNKSFVQPTTAGRYEIHELLRQYAQEQLEALGQMQAAREAHTTYYLNFLHRCEADLTGRQQLTRLAELEADRENISIAWYWAVEIRNYALIDRSLEGLYRWHWLRRDRQQEGRALLRFAREQWAPTPDQMPQPVWGRILARVLDLEGPWLADADRVRGRIESALAIARQHDNQAEIAFCLWALGFTYPGGFVYFDPDKALTYFEQSFNIYQALNDRFYQAQLLQDMGHCYRRTWQVDWALNYLQQSLKLRYEMEDKIGQGHCLRELGWVAYLAGNAVEAETYWQQAYTLRREVGDRQGVADSLFTLSLLALTRGDWEQGQSLAEEVLKTAEDIGSTRHKHWAVLELEIAASMAATKQEDTLSSVAHINTITVFEATLFHLIAGGRKRIYKRALQQALKIADQNIDRVRCLPFAAMFLAQKGEVEQAVSLLALAYQYSEFAIGWVEKLATVRSLRPDLEAALPADRFAAAWECGQTLDLEATVAQLLIELER